MSNSTAGGAKVDYQDFDDDTTEFVKKLKRVLADINIRVAAVENVKGMVDEFERRYGEVALFRIEAAIAPVLQTMLDGLDETRAALAALDEDYRTNGQLRVDNIINPIVAQAQAALVIATAQMEEMEQFLTLKQSVSERGQANGYASLGADGKIPTSQLPASVLGAMAFQTTWNANTNTPAIPAAAAANKGHYYKVSTAGTANIGGITDWQVGDMVVSNGASWDKIDNTEQVMSVAGLMGAITALALKTALALNNVDNTADANKPISSATQTALNGKQSTLSFTPVQQGTGIGQLTNAVKIGWSAGSRLKATVDNTDLGNIVTDSQLPSSQGLAKAWVNFNGTGTVAIRDSYNVSSITDNGNGDYTVNFATPMPSANYVAGGMCRPNSGGRGLFEVHLSVDPTAAAFRFQTGSFSGIQGATDSAHVLISFFGD